MESLLCCEHIVIDSGVRRCLRFCLRSLWFSANPVFCRYRVLFASSFESYARAGCRRLPFVILAEYGPHACREVTSAAHVTFTLIPVSF